MIQFNFLLFTFSIPRRVATKSALVDKLLKPDVGDILGVESNATCGAFSATILDVFVNTIFAKHVTTAQEDAFFVPYVANRTVDTALQMLHLCM